MKIIKLLFIILGLILMSESLYAKEYHVAKSGSDLYSGSSEKPFKTISKAARIAMPGDTITVHQGTYREWVDPKFGGLNDLQRIVYRAGQNEEVWIKGSEVANNWKHYKGHVWKAVFNNKMFGDFNPYQEIVKGDWLIETYGRDHHLGEVYLNGEELYEIDSLEKLLLEEPLERAADQEASKYQWYCQSNDETTIIYANFKGLNPNKELVEINVRPVVFFPRKTGMNYITVSGFHMCHAATQWGPPTAEQLGLIGPNWSKGWIIENNVISNSKCIGISLGKERGSGQNKWTNLKNKEGAQMEREAVFMALQMGWSRETIGSHIVRNNIVKDCGQAGICGHLGAIFSQIYDNHIYNIHQKGQFFGYEIAGIKLHAAIDVLIAGNFVHNAYRGLWLDWQAQGARVTRNVLFNNSFRDCKLEVNHGPLVFDNNILLSKSSLFNVSQGTLFAHNLFGGNIQQWAERNRWTPYHFPHSTSVLGSMIILSGDDRIYNNIYAAGDTTSRASTGTDSYNKNPLPTDDWNKGTTNRDYMKHLWPVYIESNMYYNLAQPFNREKHQVVNHDDQFKVSIAKEGNSYFLNIDVDRSFKDVKTQLVKTEMLGVAIATEAPFVDYDGKPLSIDKDFLEMERNSENPVVGPFESLKVGKNRIKIFSE